MQTLGLRSQLPKLRPRVGKRSDRPEPFRVFISSTFVDLQQYRQAVFESILGMGYTSEDMVYWSADERQPVRLSIDRVQRSDVMILILAHRYGYIPTDLSTGITEQEYAAARSNRIPVLAFFVDESVAWPPQNIEWEKKEQLAQFKNRVRSEIAIKNFTTPDNLAALVSQALASFAHRNLGPTARQGFQPRYVVRIDSAVSLKSLPDVTVEIGTSQDGLPLLLKVRRSRDIDSPFEALKSMLDRPRTSLPDALLNSYRQAIEDYAANIWALDGMQSVRMNDGSFQQLFVTTTSLSRLFSSTLTALLVSKGDAIKASRSRPGTRDATAAHPVNDGIHRALLQSEGGSNRFLGISSADGSCYSVGTLLGQFGGDRGQWVEWRPFIAESLSMHVLDAKFVIRSPHGAEVVSVAQYEHSLIKIAENLAYQEQLPISVGVEVPKVSVTLLMVRLAEAIAKIHGAGFVHGDVKPDNVLLSMTGLIPIDSFELAPGDIAPGWTPGWSAPEQVLGAPVSFATDIFAFGRMISEVLEGILVGEVRKFKVASTDGGQEEFDLFSDPSIRLPRGQAKTERYLPWLDLARRCMRFDPSQRPQTIDAVIQELKILIEKYPPSGTVRFTFDNNLVFAQFLDGGVGLARVVTDESDIV